MPVRRGPGTERGCDRTRPERTVRSAHLCPPAPRRTARSPRSVAAPAAAPGQARAGCSRGAARWRGQECCPGRLRAAPWLAGIGRRLRSEERAEHPAPVRARREEETPAQSIGETRREQTPPAAPRGRLIANLAAAGGGGEQVGERCRLPAPPVPSPPQGAALRRRVRRAASRGAARDGPSRAAGLPSGRAGIASVGIGREGLL